jgi:uncharacterized protein (TIGR02391 family)
VQETDGIDIGITQLYLAMKKDPNLAKFLADWQNVRLALLYAGFPAVATDAFEKIYELGRRDIRENHHLLVAQAMKGLYRQGTLPAFLSQILRAGARPKFRDEFLQHLHVLGLDWHGKTNQIRATGRSRKAGKPADQQVIYSLASMHPSINEVSERLFLNGHYPQAIFEAYKAVVNQVKKKSGRDDLDGQELMSTVFSYKNPILKLNKLQSKSDQDEQMGFMFLFMGATVGIRNPKAHDIVEQRDPIRAMEYLALASLLSRRVEESTKSSESDT